MKSKASIALVSMAVVAISLCASFAAVASPAPASAEVAVALQPFADQVRRLERTLEFLGQPLPAADQKQINAALAGSDEQAAAAKIQTILDKHVLVQVSIDAESRVDAHRGAAAANLIQDGSRIFLVKVVNDAGVTSFLHVQSPNSGDVYLRSSGKSVPVRKVTPQEVRERWAEITLYSSQLAVGGFKQKPRPQRLTGLSVEYMLLVIYSRDAGERSATLSFDVGQGTQDVGFLNEVNILFKITAAHAIRMHVFDSNGHPTMASFVFKDRLGRIYPNPAKRLAPDFFFQPQIYRANGEYISLPPGNYTVSYTGGPEYVTQTRDFKVGSTEPQELDFHLKRWIDPAQYGWFSGDHHIHAAGCAHYETPSQGVKPAAMDRQVRGEHLNVGCVLTWGPCYYYQKQFFRGRHDNPVSKKDQLLHYDVEVSGFPSSHAGHLVLLNLKDQDYPGTKRIEDWPTWDLPILRWAKSQGATVGFAHSGWGLQVSGNALPNYQIPGYDGIGANEYIVDVTYPHTVDFISAGDTPYDWELNMWYQTLNVGYRTRISGETDFPCIYDSRVGEGRSYAKVTGPLTYSSYMEAIRAGRSYVSDGRSHLMNFSINGTLIGTHASEVDLSAPGTVHAERHRRGRTLIPCPTRKFAIVLTTRSLTGTSNAPGSATRARFPWNSSWMDRRPRARRLWPTAACKSSPSTFPSAKAVGSLCGFCPLPTPIPSLWWWVANPCSRCAAAPNGAWMASTNAGRRSGRAFPPLNCRRRARLTITPGKFTRRWWKDVRAARAPAVDRKARCGAQADAFFSSLLRKTSISRLVCRSPFWLEISAPCR